MFDLLLSADIWAAFLTLLILEVVLGIDNLIFVSIVAGRVPAHQQNFARRLGISLALIMRLGMLFGIAWIVGLTAPVFDLGITGTVDSHGHPSFETAFSWRDLILIGGGIFLTWKATTEIRHKLTQDHTADKNTGVASMTLSAAVAQIIVLDVVFSVDSILTAVGMTDQVPVMIAAVIVSVAIMLLASGPVMRFVNNNPSVIMLALAFLLMIGMVLIADGFGHHVPKGYIYGAMAFAAFVELLNFAARRRRARS